MFDEWVDAEESALRKCWGMQGQLVVNILIFQFFSFVYCLLSFRSWCVINTTKGTWTLSDAPILRTK